MDYCLYYARLVTDDARLWMIRMILIGVSIFALPLIVFLSIKYRQKKRHQKRTEEKIVKNGSDVRKEALAETEISVFPDSELGFQRISSEPGLQRISSERGPQRISEEPRERVKANEEQNKRRAKTDAR